MAGNSLGICIALANPTHVSEAVRRQARAAVGAANARAGADDEKQQPLMSHPADWRRLGYVAKDDLRCSRSLRLDSQRECWLLARRSPEIGEMLPLTHRFCLPSKLA